ncbi:MAG: leucyl aminopeptidase family protein, partial [Rickettsiales bacterium]|nr:leucyl aminopeptidase family protein [Rickettsiales bacterium]
MVYAFPVIEKAKLSLPLHVLREKGAAAWLKAQNAHARAWLEGTGFKAVAGNFAVFPASNGSVGGAVCVVADAADIWALAALPMQLPVQAWHIEGKLSEAEATQVALGWALATYRFSRYKTQNSKCAQLVAPKGCDLAFVRSMAGAMGWARDLINTPAGDMHPAALAQEAATWAHSAGGKALVIKGDALLKANYPLVHAVGKAADVPPHLVDIRFAKKGAPKVTLVGKGVTFDSGGLDIKSSGNMKLMKKDMGGAAAVLALARVIVESGLPVSLRVLLPIVENAISGNAMRPLDVVRSRKGLTVEIGNTDAEGRLILCDALAEADSEQPDLLIVCATLTGAARVALGTDIPAFFTPDEALASEISRHAGACADPLWRLPLWKGYRKQIASAVADLTNDPESSYGGAITAALYL